MFITLPTKVLKVLDLINAILTLFIVLLMRHGQRLLTPCKELW